MKIEITIPTTLNDITLDQYQRYLSIAKDNQDTEFLTHKMIEIFCEIPLSQVVNIKYNDAIDIVNTINTIFQTIPKHTQIFKLGKTEFGFIPNLQDISIGEFADLDKYLTNFDEFHKALAVLYRPITGKVADKYEIEKYNGTHNYSEVMKYTPLGIALGAQVFFYNLRNELLTSTLNSLAENPTIQTYLDKLNSERNGDGLHLSIHSLKETFKSLIEFQKLDLQQL